MLKRDVEFLDGGQGFAQLFAERGGGFAEGVENFFFGFCGDLFLSNGVAGGAVGGFQREDVFAAERTYGAGDEGFATSARTNLAGDVGSEFGGIGAGHFLEGFVDGAAGDHSEERRLAQGHGESNFESVVKDGIGSVVGEVGEEDGVFGGEAFFVVADAEIENCTGDEDDQDSGGDGDFPDF